MLQRQDIRNRFPTPSDFREFLKNNATALGIQGWKGASFDFRGESTPSVQINPGWWCDHGDGRKTGDLIDLIANARGLNLSDTGDFKTAMRIAEELLNLPSGTETGQIFSRTNVPERVQLSPVLQEDVDSWYDNLKSNPATFVNLANGLLRNLTKPEKIIATKKIRLGLQIQTVEIKNPEGVVYNTFIDQRVIIPEVDENGVVHNFYAYKRSSSRKGLRRKSGDNDERAKPTISGMALLPEFDKNIPIMFAEGHSDYAHAIGLEMQSNTGGSASMSLLPFLPFYHGRTLHLFPDNDKAGAGAIARWGSEITEYNKSLKDEDKVKAKFFWWSIKTKQLALNLIEQELKKSLERSGKMVENIPQERFIELCDSHVKFNKEFWNLECIYEEENVVLKKGYDFTDFIDDKRGTDVFNKIVNTYKQHP